MTLNTNSSDYCNLLDFIIFDSLPACSRSFIEAYLYFMGNSDQSLLQKFRGSFVGFLKKSKTILIAYLIIVIFWIAHFLYLQFGTLSYNDYSYHNSFSASLLEDILFFGVVGLLIYVLSSKDAKDGDLRSRISILANNDNVDDIAKDYLHDEIKPILGYNKETRINIIIEDISKDGKYIRIYTDIQNTIVNMCRNSPFTLKNSAFSISAVNEVDRIYATIQYVGIYVEGDKENGIIPVNSESNKPRIFLRKPEYKHVIDEFEIPSGGTAVSKMTYSIWEELDTDKEKSSNWFYVGNLRFTDKVIFDIKNGKDLDLKFDLQINRASDGAKIKLREEHELKQSHLEIVPIIEKLYPDDRIEMIFSRCE